MEMKSHGAQAARFVDFRFDLDLGRDDRAAAAVAKLPVAMPGPSSCRYDPRQSAAADRVHDPLP